MYEKTFTYIVIDINLVLLTACGLEEKIKEHFVDYATSLAEQTSKADTPARELPANPVGCPDWQKNETVDITESMTLPFGCKYEAIAL